MNPGNSGRCFIVVVVAVDDDVFFIFVCLLTLFLINL